MPTGYDYLIANTANGVVDLGTLDTEIRAAAISSQSYDGATQVGVAITVFYDAPITVSEEAILDSVIAAHQGNETPQNTTEDQIAELQTRVASLESTDSAIRTFEVKASNKISIGSADFVEILSLSNLPEGRYVVLFNAVGAHTANNAQLEYAIGISGSILSPTVRRFGGSRSTKDVDLPFSVHDIVQLNIGQTLQVFVRRNGGSDVVRINERTLTVIKIA